MKVTQEELNEFWKNVEAILATECPNADKVMPYYRENYQPIEGHDFSVLAKIVSDIVQYDLKTLKRMMCMVHMNDDKNLEDFFILIHRHFIKRSLPQEEVNVFARVLNYDFNGFIEIARESNGYADGLKAYATGDNILFAGYMYGNVHEFITNPSRYRSCYSHQRHVPHQGHEDEGIKDGETILMPKFMKNVSADSIEQENTAMIGLVENTPESINA